MGGVVVVVGSLEVCAKKNIFICSDTKTNSLLINNNELYIGYLTRKMKVFSLFLIYQDHIEHMEKSIHIQENNFRFSFYLLRLHRA